MIFTTIMPVPLMQDPLADLRDIHLPAEPGWWPPAPGWWLSAVLIIVLLTTAILRFRNYRRRTAPRRAALKELAHILSQHEQDDLQLMTSLSALLKRVSRLNHPQSVSLSGKPWLEFLDSHMPEPAFTTPAGQVLAEGIWQSQPPEPNIDALARMIRIWLKHNAVLAR